VSHWEAMLSYPNEWVEQWHILRPDADFRDVTKSNDDTLQANSSSYDVTRSSPVGDGETSDDDEGRSTSSQFKPMLVFPNDGDDGENTINLTFPRKSEKKASFELDDYKLQSLTRENTRKNSISASSVKSSEGAGRVSI